MFGKFKNLYTFEQAKIYFDLIYRDLNQNIC